jgi:hypothetical protein
MPKDRPDSTQNQLLAALSCFTSKLHVLISETLAARGSIWKFE